MIGPHFEQARRTSTRGIQLAGVHHCSLGSPSLLYNTIKNKAKFVAYATYTIVSSFYSDDGTFP
jgi:hypothetical protein